MNHISINREGKIQRVVEANTDNPVDEGSAIELTKAGNLNLFDSHRNNRWYAHSDALAGAVTERKANCECPPGIAFIDGQERFKGCLRNSSQSCTEKKYHEPSKLDASVGVQC
eukprot:Gb_05506 [translate_table: standard]